MRRWIGWSVIGVGLIHLFLGILLFHAPLSKMLATGWVNSVGDREPHRYLAFWFFIAGFITLVLGYLIDWIQRVPRLPLPAALGWSLLAIAVVGVTASPVSGFWLVFIPALGTIVGARTTQR